jgi:enamine deaminase RidA (YjgF/YER057c/UK114 family)
MINSVIRFCVAVLLLAAVQLCALADVIRYPNEGSSLPIAAAVEVGGLLFHSGVIPPPANPALDRSARDFWGDTETQSRNVLRRIEESLAAKGLEMGDVVKLTVFLVGDPERDGRMDFQGFMRAYEEFFGERTQGRLPARSVVEVAGLVAPGMFVEIEAIAVRPTATAGR